MSANDGTATNINNISYDEYLFHLFTSKTKPFKDMVELLHQIIPEVNFDCTPTGIRLFNINSDHTQMVHMKLFGDKFEHYYCPEKQRFGINMGYLFKIIKLIESDETLRIYVLKDEPDSICIERYNRKDDIQNTKYLNLIEVEDKNFYYPDIRISSVIKFPSTRFQKLCKEIKSFTDQIQIKSSNDILYINSVDNHNTKVVKQKICIRPTNNSDSIVLDNGGNSTFEGIYDLKPLLDFSKCSPLSPFINIYLENDMPLTLECNICSFGEIKLVVSPKEEGI